MAHTNTDGGRRLPPFYRPPMKAQVFPMKREFRGQNGLKHQSKDAFKVRRTPYHIGQGLTVPQTNVDSEFCNVPDTICFLPH